MSHLRSTAALASKAGLLIGTFLIATSLHAQVQVFPKWIDRFDGVHFDDQAVALATDGQGNVYVTGRSCFDALCSEQQAVTIKYDRSGCLVWKAWLSSQGSSSGPIMAGFDVKADAAGNAYVLFASFLSPPNSDVPITDTAIAKYGPSGVREWINYIAGTAAVQRSFAQLAVSPQGNAYVTLESENSNDPNTRSTTTLKYETNGKLIWSKVAAPVPSSANIPTGLGLDSKENIYTLVFSSPDDSLTNPNSRSIIFKYDSAGNLLKTFGGDVLGPVSLIGGPLPPSFRVDSQGNTYFAGESLPSPNTGTRDQIVATFRSDGTLGWLHDFGLVTENPSPFSGVAAITTDSNGDVFLAQNSSNSVGGIDMSVIKLDPTGQLKFSTTPFNELPGGGAVSRAIALVVNAAGESYVTAEVPGSRQSGFQIATIKYDSTGNETWIEHYDGGQSDDIPVAMSISGDGGLVVVGRSQGATSAQDWVTINYVQDAAGLSVPTLSFGNETLHAQSSAQTLTLTNTAEVPLDSIAISVTGDFHLINNCPSTLVAHASCSLGVTFIPIELGTRTGTLTVHDSWAGSVSKPQTTHLTGTGTV